MWRRRLRLSWQLKPCTQQLPLPPRLPTQRPLLCVCVCVQAPGTEVPSSFLPLSLDRLAQGLADVVWHFKLREVLGLGAGVGGQVLAQLAAENPRVRVRESCPSEVEGKVCVSEDDGRACGGRGVHACQGEVQGSLCNKWFGGMTFHALPSHPLNRTLCAHRHKFAASA